MKYLKYQLSLFNKLFNCVINLFKSYLSLYFLFKHSNIKSLILLFSNSFKVAL